MCGTCGCSNDVKATVTDAATGEHSHLYRDGRTSSAHRHEHGPSEPHGDSPSLSAHDHAHGHAHGDAHHAHHHHGPSGGGAAVQTVDVQAAILGKNDALAARNRAWLAGRQVLALNLVSSPGSGKTSLLERTIRDLAGERWIGVIEGDQQTMLDAERIRATGAPSVQVNTGTGCHLEADMVWEALRILHPPVGGLVLIENVGNLVCPALFDLGEAAKVAVLSVTEGEDKPAKYPHMFRESALILLNKIDLLPYLDFDLDRCVRLAREVNPDVEVMPLSVKSGAGLEPWYAWLRSRAGELEQRAFA